MAIRFPDEMAICALASRESFERGREYWRRGAVSGLVKRGDTLIAKVEGSEAEPYRVTIRLDEGGVVEARCTCPYDWGGCCKHIVATLLTRAHDPGAVRERPPLRDLLSALERDRLIDLWVKRLRNDPGLADWLEAELAAALPASQQTVRDVEPIAALPHAALADRHPQRRYWGDYRPAGDAAQLQALVEKAVPLLEAGDGRNALRILEAITDAFLTDWLDYASGFDEEHYVLFADLGRILAEAALMSDLTREERDDLATTVTDWQDQLADFGLDESFNVAVSALESGWDAPVLQAVLAGKAEACLSAEIGEGEEAELTTVRLRVLDAQGRWDAYLNLARAARAYTSVSTMLVRQGRVPEAMAYAQETFTVRHESLELARVLREAGRHEEALTTAAEGLRFNPNLADESNWRSGGSVVPLAHWLRDYAGAMGRRDLALTAARAAFEQTLSFQDYCALKGWAGESWNAMRQPLLGRLVTASSAPDRTEILLEEGLIDEAVRAVGRGEDGTPNAVLLQLMEAACTSHPDWVISIAERRAVRIMDAGDASSYELAAQWLKQAALAYDAAGRFEEWTVLIESLIARYRRKYKLRPLLEALRNGP